MRILPRVLALGFVISIVGCEYFTNVTIPQTDTIAPTVWGGVYDVAAGKYQVLSPSDFTYTLHAADITNTYLAVGAGIDSGGTAKVVVQGDVAITCQPITRGTPLPAKTIVVPLPAQVVTATGNVGDSVSNGQYAYDALRFDTYLNQEYESPYCPTQTVLIGVLMIWQTTAVDFHGNESLGPTGTIDVLP